MSSINHKPSKITAMLDFLKGQESKWFLFIFPEIQFFAYSCSRNIQMTNVSEIFTSNGYTILCSFRDFFFLGEKKATFF